MGVGTQVHPLEKEHTSGWWVLLYNQRAYLDIQGLKHNCFLSEGKKKQKSNCVEFGEKNMQHEKIQLQDSAEMAELEK